MIILIISSANNNRQYGSIFYLDSLILYHDSIPEPDTCYALQNLHLVTKDTFNITIAWTDTSAMCWQMEYGEHGYVLGSDTCYITTDTMLVLTRLTPSTEYDIWGNLIRRIRESTGDVVEESFWSYDEEGRVVWEEYLSNAGSASINWR